MKATRNRLTHRGWTVDYQIMHDVATTELRKVATAVSGRLDLENPYDLAGL